MAFALGGEAALVTDGRGHAAGVDDLLEGMERLGTVAKGFTEGRSAHRNDHELLQVEVVVGVSTAVDDVHHRDGHLEGTHAAEVAVERHASSAAARATAMETARMALAPRRPLFSVPSSAIIVRSM